MSKGKKSLRSWVLGGLLSLCCLYAVLGSRPVGERHREEQGFGLREPASSDFFAQALLVESIVAILKKYYVDAERVGNRLLLQVLVQALSENLELSVHKAPEGLTLEKNQQALFLQTPAQLSEELLTLQILKLAEFIDTLAQNAPSAVHSDLKTAEKNLKKESSVLFTLQTLLLSLDPHSNLLSQEAYEELRQGTEGTFGGLGVLVGLRDQLLTVIKPLPRSPAERMGILAQDRILAIDGKDTYGYSLVELVEHMRGAPGSQVRLSMLREGEACAREVALNREVILVDSVTSEIQTRPSGSLLYLSIESFTSRTADEITAALRQFRSGLKPAQMPGILLDLRNNPGGLLDQAVKVADAFLAQGVIVSTQGFSKEEEKAQPQPEDELECPMLVLINEESASASEIVAGALQDRDRASVIGQPSFGKGSVQTIFELPEQRALKLTIARYYTPSGDSIQNIGISPDIWLHPVFVGKENLNLLGENRYKSERFLFHHLQSQEKQLAPWLAPANADFKGYFLKKRAESLDPLTEFDHERNFAVLVMDKLFQQAVIEKNRYRASASLTAIASSLKTELARKSLEVSRYLHKTFKVQWAQNDSGLKTNQLSLKILKNKPSAVAPGDKLALPFVISNTQSVPVDQLTLFIRHTEQEFPTQELMIGRVAAAATSSGVMAFEVPTFWPPGRLRVQVGLAWGGQTLPQTLQEISVQVLARTTPQFAADISLVAETGGQQAGLLEAGERAKVAIALHNHSAVGAKSMAIKLLNLAGTQVRLLRQEEQLAELAPFQSTTVYFDVQGAGQVLTEKLALGLFVESKDLRIPFMQQTFIRAVPGRQKVPARRAAP